MVTGSVARELLGEAFAEVGIRNFKPVEFINPDRLAPPLPILFHIVPTAYILQKARDSLGPLVINSGYRDPVYNASVGGVPESQHVRFTAADVRPLLTDPLALYEWLDSSGYRERLGLGIYDSFVHVDCRHWPGLWKGPKPDHPARWDNRT